MKKFLCVFLSLALVLAATAGCDRKYDPQMKAETSDSSQSESEPSSQSTPEPIIPEPIMPVPSSQSDPEPEPEPENDPAPEEDEESDEDEDNEDGEDEEDEEGDEEDEEGEGEGFLPPEVPHGEDLAWLDLTKVTVSELKPVLDQVLDRANYFCKYGLTGRFTEAGIDARKEVAIKRTYRGEANWTFYPYTNLPYHTLDELQEGLLTSFTWSVISADMYYLFEIMVDDGEQLYYADGVVGLSKVRDWDTSEMTIKEATSRRIVLHMPTAWNGYDFDADLTLQLQDGYLVLDANYFAFSPEDLAKRHHSV